MFNRHLVIKNNFLLTAVAAACFFISNVAFAGVVHLKLKRSDASTPITKLEVVALVKSKMKGRILSVKKQRSYKFPDCYHVKLLQFDGEYQLIKVACRK